MNELIEKFTNEFKESIRGNEQEKQLVEKFRYMIIDTIKSLENNHYEKLEIKSSITRIANKWINLDYENKKKRLLGDSNFGKIMEISNQVYNLAIEVAINKKKYIDFSISEKIDELENLLEKVKKDNKEEAKLITSETILDLQFIEDPYTNAISLRLGNIIKNINKEER